MKMVGGHPPSPPVCDAIYRGGGKLDKSISNGLRTTFLVHMIIMAVAGVALWLVPGRTLLLVGWIPATFQVPGTDVTAPGTVFVDGVMTRALGAALLALAFSSYRGWRAHQWSEVAFLVQLEVVFSVLGLVAFLSPIIRGGVAQAIRTPFWWASVVILAAFILSWGLALRQSNSSNSA